MPGDDLLISALGSETRAAFLEDGVLARLAVSYADGRPRAGDIVLGRVVKVAAQMDAAFVDVGFDRDGFLGLSEIRPANARSGRIGDYVSEGDPVLVQVQQEPVGAKGAKLTARPALTDRLLVFLPGQPGVRLSRRIDGAAERSRLADAIAASASDTEGWIVRSAASGAHLDRIMEEADRHRRRWADIQQRRSAARPPQCLCRGQDAVLAAVIEESGRSFDRVLADDPWRLADIRAVAPELSERWEFHTGVRALFDAHGVEDQIQALLRPNVELPSGGNIEIAETAAVVAIDVDTGAASRGEPEATALRVNLEAAEAVARHIRLRDLAGHMVIDFVPMRQRENRSRVVAALRHAMQRDRRPVQLAGFTPFGLVELTRQRRERSLGRRLTTACSACEGTGRVRSATTLAHEALRRVLVEARIGGGPTLKITASPPVVAALRGTAAPGLSEVERKIGTAVILNEDAAMALESFDVTTVGRGED